MTESDAEAKSESESQKLVQNFMKQLDVDQDVATILVQEGFSTIEELAYVPVSELANISEFDEEMVKELRNRARDVLLTQAIASEEKVEHDIEDLMKVWRRLGRQPTTRELIKRDGVSRYSLAAYERCFGSWHKALLALRDHVNGKRLKLPVGRTGPKKERRRRAARRDSRRITARLRTRVLVRDCSTCRLCGTSPLKDPATTLHVDHIVPWSKGGRTVPANLQTLCARCNLGKGDQRFSSLSRKIS